MTQDIRFYHLERNGVEQSLPLLLSKAYQSNKRVLVLCKDVQQSESLTKLLWSYSEESFLPHGNEKDGGDIKEHPIYLTHTLPAKEEQPDTLIMLEPQPELKSEEIENFSMICLMFDGRAQDVLDLARKNWRMLRDASKAFEKEKGEVLYDLSYFQQTPQGGWEKKA